MKEKPILFSGPMVRAILDCRKTQTRRVVKPQPDIPGWVDAVRVHKDAEDGQAIIDGNDVCIGHLGKIKYRPGARLWVREAWMAEWGGSQEQGDDYPLFGVRYRADNAWEERKCHPVEHSNWYNSWRPSIFMPRWASRIDLEITHVRVERLQDISEEDAQAEGAPSGILIRSKPDPVESDTPSHRQGFCLLWDSINRKTYPWESNPWVWALTFRRIRP